MIVHCIAKALFVPQVALCRLDRDLAKQELDLLRITTRFVASLRAFDDYAVCGIRCGPARDCAIRGRRAGGDSVFAGACVRGDG